MESSQPEGSRGAPANLHHAVALVRDEGPNTIVMERRTFMGLPRPKYGNRARVLHASIPATLAEGGQLCSAARSEY